MRRFSVFLAVLASLVFIVSCGDGNGSSSGKKQGELYGACYPNKTCNDGLTCDEENDVCLPANSDEDPDGNTDTSDADISDNDPGNHDTEEPDDTDNDIEISDIDISDDDPNDHDNTEKPDENPEEPEDNDITEEPTDSDTPETPDETPDNETPVNSEATENHKISGIFQVGTGVSGIEAALFECGSTEKIAFANTDAKGKFSFNTDITASKTYCVKAGDFASCFKGLSDHTANISEITTAAYLLDKTCADLRKSETKIRTYAKLGTGEWLGELDYSKLSGIKEGLKLFSNYLKTTNNKTLSEKIAEDANKETPEFGKFFNGFRISANKTEIVLDESTDNSTTFSAEGGSTKIASGFKITWTMKNKNAEAATYKFTTSTPGEYVARAKLVSGNTTLSDGSASVLYLQKKKSGSIYLNGKSKNISQYIDNGIYVVIPKNTVVKKDGNVVTKITYDILSAGGNQVSRLKFYPEGAVFEGDSMYFVYELGTVYGGDPIMLSAKRTNTDGTVDVLNSAAGDPIMMAAAGDPIMTTAAGDPIMQAAAGDPIMTNAAGDPIMTAAAGDPIMTSAAGDPIMTSAAGDPIMNAAAGDPIMTSAAGDPIMAAAAGDPIMMGTSSSAMISQTNHYSIFTVEAANLPVSVDALLDRWCDGSFYRNYSPVAFIKAGFQKFKPESTLLPYLTCEGRKFGDLGNDLYELINKQVGYQRNLNLIENIFFVSEFYNRMKVRRESGEVAAVKNGLELRSAIAALYTATTSYNRSATLADLFDSSMIPLTYSGVTPADYTAKAKSSITGNSGSGETYTATKKEMMIFANYITTSSKGPDFDSVESVLTPDQLVCAWFDSNTEPQNCNKIYTLNDAGHVTLGGTELSAAEANAIFSEHFMPMNSRLSDEEKLDLFRIFYLALKYAGTIFYGGSDIDELNDALLKTAYLVFDGIDDNAKAVSIVDTFDASVHTVSVLDGNDMAIRPYLTKLSALTDQISLKVAAESADVEKVLINIEGKEFEKVQENTRTYYKQTGDLKEKSIVLTPGSLSGTTSLEILLGSENVDALGNITGRMTIVVNSKISGKTYSTQKAYEFFVNGESDGVNSKEVPANIQIRVNDSNGNAIPDNANPTIILNPGNRVFYSAGNLISIENLTPAAYTIDAFADGYYAKNVSVNVPSGATFDVEIRLDEETTGSADANLELSVKIDTAKHPSKVYIQIYNDDMDLVANETAKFDENLNAYQNVNIEMNSGRYTLLAVGEDMYNYLEAITLYEGNNSKEITVIAKNACGNGIVDSAEECEPSQSEPVLCGTIYPAAPNPNEHATCDPDTCTFNKTACGKAAFCGDGIIDSPAEHCDGGSKACAEIAGSGDSGSAPCATDCSRYITENNCRKTTESCGNLKENAVWNDGEGKFTQTHDGANWLPATKSASYGITKEECVFSCKKGYKWDGSDCIPSPLSLALICTGETDCFSDTDETECPAYGTVFFGQDAQYAQTGFCTPHKLTAAVNGIVKETYTHYEWQAVSSEEMNWDDANDYCSHLNDESGSSALWRIPSPSELLTIVNSGTASPALDDKFTARGHTFWASEDSRNSEKAWMLGENGEITSVDKADTNSVICVKHGFDAVQNRFSATAETVKDSDSGLMWQKQPVASVTWEKALSYCEEVSTADKFDWRLPNRNELASLINYEKNNGSMSDFPGIAEKGFWTSTSSATAGNEAWTVDFASGKIEPAEKNDTKYVICVRNDEPCFGDECPNACGFAPCKGMANSTGLCTASDYTFTCGCKSGFNWNHGKCLLATTRYTACEGLPENAVWNTVFGISQSYDGEDWYPSNIGTFNKTPSSTECRFVCATNYTWDAENDTCQPKSTVTQCSEKKPNSEWNSVSRISQTWDGEKWVPSATSVYNTEPSEDECRFICKEHYNWNDENNTCDGETQPATCIGLPANAHWWNEDASITQTWTNGGWAPASAGRYNDSQADNECFFGCNENYSWKNNACVADEKFNVACNDLTLPDNAEWNQYNQINQTWSGEKWLPTTEGSYNETPDPAYCRFKCKAHYNWNGSTCSAETNIATCTGKPSNAEWNTASSIIQYWDGEKFSPTATASYGETPTTEECRFKCNENYTVSDDRKSCKPSTRTIDCEGLPENAIWNTGASWGRITQTWSGSDWTPSLSGVFSETPSTENCVFKCFDNYEWQGGRCVAKKQTSICTGLPENAQWNSVATVLQEWKENGEWEPSDIGIYSEEESLTECRFKCRENFTWDGKRTCVANTRFIECNPRPANSLWNEVHFITQTWNGKEWLPTLDPKYSVSPSNSECKYKCDTGYYPLDGRCVADPCNDNGYNPCSEVNNSTGVCTANNNVFLPYSCECADGYSWHGKTGCRSKKATLGNICTDETKCFNNEEEIVCPSQGNDFYGQDAQYAEMGYCTPKILEVKETIVGAETQKTVIDKNTGLEWLKSRSDESYNQEDAVIYCDGLVYGGHTDWRLPSARELMTVLSYTQILPELDREYFENIYVAWTSTPDLNESNNAVLLAFGQFYPEIKTNEFGAVCVRGNALPESEFSAFTVNGDEIVKDLTTELYWQKTYVTEKTWPELLEYCENLEYGGFSDWRMPNISELRSLINYEKSYPASDFPDMPSDWLISSTTQFSADTVEGVLFETGLESGLYKSGSAGRVRCVRSDLCDEGEFLFGKNCVASPCKANSCEIEHSDGICTPLNLDDFSCGCDEGYSWNGSKCINNPCFNNQCSAIEHSDGICTPLNDTEFACGCADGYFWKGSRCMTKHAFGNICTGQNKCYNNSEEMYCPANGEDFFGQDAQYAAKERCTPQSFSDDDPDSNHPEEIIVIDNNTGLMWQKNIPDLKPDWYHAVAYCSDLEYAGYSDWRLPKPEEFLSIADLKNTDPSIFTYTGPGYFSPWTSASVAKSIGNAFIMEFSSMTTNMAYTGKEASDSFDVVCVRGNILPKSRFVVSRENGYEIVTDTVSGLIWQKTSLGWQTWKDALAYCENSEYAGFTDWRVPNLKEAFTLADFTKTSGIATNFPDMPDIALWTSNTIEDNVQSAYVLDFGYGIGGGYMEKTDYQSVLCVR